MDMSQVDQNESPVAAPVWSGLAPGNDIDRDLTRCAVIWLNQCLESRVFLAQLSRRKGPS